MKMDKEKEKKYKREYMKEYMQRSEPKRKRKLYLKTPKAKARKAIEDKKYRNKPGMKLIKNEREKIRRKKPEVKVKMKVYKQNYNGRPEIKISRNIKRTIRRNNDMNYNIKCGVRCRFNQAIKNYSTNGKNMPTNKYLNMKAIIKQLSPFPKETHLYHKDHIIPLSWFDFNNPKEIEWAFAPENWQWLRKEINMWKGDRLILSLNIEEQDEFVKKIEGGRA